MGLFARLGALIRGFFARLVGKAEESNPQLIFEDIKLQIDKARKQAEQQIIDIQTNAELIKIEMKTAGKNLETMKMRIEQAKKQGDKDLLIELLMREEELQATYDTYNTTQTMAMQDVEKIRGDYKLFESEMNAKLNELKSLKSQAKMAELKENINSVNAQYASKENLVGKVNDAMDKARDLVNNKTARANAVESLGEENTELKMKRLDLNSARERAAARAQAMLETDEGFEVKEKIDTSFQQRG